jgi:hypothetical protein
MMKVILIAGKAQNGKDTTANFLKENMENGGYKVLIIHFADYLKFLCKSYFGWDGTKSDNGRFILQHVGTDIIRQKSPDFWLNNVIEFLKVMDGQYDFVLIPDVRFKNELAFEEGRKLWPVWSVRVNRFNFESPLTESQQQHISETDLDDSEFDYSFSASSLFQVKRRCDDLFENLNYHILQKESVND